MKLRTIAVAATACLCTARPADAQSIGNMLKDDALFVARDVGAIWASPFTGSGRDWAAFAGVMGLFGVTMLVDRDASDWSLRQDSAGRFRALDELRRGGVLFTGKYVVPPVAMLYVAGIALKNQGMRDAVMGCAASWAAQSPPRRMLAHAIGRARPDTSKDDPNTFGPNDPQLWEIGW